MGLSRILSILHPVVTQVVFVPELKGSLCTSAKTQKVRYVFLLSIHFFKL